MIKRVPIVSLLLPTLLCVLSADPVAVRYMEGTDHGFLVLRSAEGKVLAWGDVVQVAHVDRVTARLIFRFKDGSIDDDSSVFTQRNEFRLVSDHHIQKGPSFPQPIDMWIKVAAGEVIVHHKEKGEDKVDTGHFKIAPDVSNGIILNVLKNISPSAKETKVSYIAATPKPQMLKLTITPQGADKFLVAGHGEKALHYVVKPELGGLEGILAPILGKQPKDMDVWIAEGTAPAFVRFDGPLYLGAPVISIQMTSPAWPESEHASR